LQAGSKYWKEIIKEIKGFLDEEIYGADILICCGASCSMCIVLKIIKKTS